MDNISISRLAHLCILQIEDEETDVLLLEHAFKKAGIANPVRIATDGAEALAYLAGEGKFADRCQFPLPALVLLDLKLPDRSGLDVLQWLRGQSPFKRLVVVALTSSDHERDMRRAYELGVNSYVLKPTALEQRVRFAQHLKGWWLGCNEFPPPG